MNRDNFTDKDLEVIKKYQVMYELPESIDYEGLKFSFMMAGILLGLVVLIFSFSAFINHTQDKYAEEIYDLQNNDELDCFYFETELKRSKLYVVHGVKRDVIYDRLLDLDCMTRSEVNDLKHQDFCDEFNTISCRVDELNNPRKQIDRADKR